MAVKKALATAPRNYAPHIAVVIGGNLVSEVQVEIWQCTINVLPASGAVLDFDTDGYLLSIQAALQTWWEYPGYKNGNTATLTFVKANAIGADGHYESSTETSFYDYSPATAGGGAIVHPDILCSVTSWTTDKARGPGSKGRIYLPNQWGDGAHMTISSADQSGIMDAGKGLLHVLQNTAVPAVQTVPVVASGVNATNTPITGVAAGNVLDVQRRRKNALVETYTHAEWP
uniref:Uncharacterized protein n=1 Tax=uncultured prokaryote TaxID=198431 RepID=A0A0H5Q3V9_9ZZZZ|nr:hypothetical protein [uncultured prokaryote]